MYSYLERVISTAEICVSAKTGKSRGNCFCLLYRSIEFHRTICCSIVAVKLALAERIRISRKQDRSIYV